MTVQELSQRLPAADELLSALGLETRRSSAESMLSALAIFGAGLAVGAALGVLFAPRSGEEIRSQLGERMSRMRDDLASTREAATDA
jgi:YtxH-like protein